MTLPIPAAHRRPRVGDRPPSRHGALAEALDRAARGPHSDVAIAHPMTVAKRSAAVRSDSPSSCVAACRCPATVAAMRRWGFVAAAILLAAGCSENGGGQPRRAESSPSSAKTSAVAPATPPAAGAPIGDVVAWIGAGLSAPAGLPLWRDLKNSLCSALEAKSRGLEGEERERAEAQLTIAKTEKK